MTRTATALANVPMFAELPEKALQRLERLARDRSFAAGDVIMREGEEGVGAFLISSGKVDVTRGGGHLASLGAGDFFGEMALLDHHRRSATVTAAEPTECVVLLRSDLIAELRGNAGMAIEMLGILSHRLREADERATNWRV